MEYLYHTLFTLKMKKPPEQTAFSFALDYFNFYALHHNPDSPYRTTNARNVEY